MRLVPVTVGPELGEQMGWELRSPSGHTLTVRSPLSDVEFWILIDAMTGASS